MNDTKKEIIELIQAIKPFDETEQYHKKDTLGWIESGVEIFRTEKAEALSKHLVVYTVLCDLDEEKILLLAHKNAGLLLAGGGHVDKDELPYVAVKRELQEEMGMKAEFLEHNWKVPFFISQIETVGKTAGHMDVDLWYLLEADSQKPLNDDLEEFKREFGEYDWYGFDEILVMPIEKFDRNLQRFIRKLKNVYGGSQQITRTS